MVGRGYNRLSVDGIFQADKPFFREVIENDVRVFFRGDVGCLQPDFRVQRRFIRIADACEFFQLTAPLVRRDP